MTAFGIAFLCTAVAYMVGAIPFGLLVARGLKGVDIRTLGSGNIGATNVGRVFGFRYFLLVFALDMLKGLVPTLAFPALAARMLGRPMPVLPVAVAVAAILGHNFPVYLRFRGGKGVSTSFGALLALDPVAMVAAGVGFLVFFLITRIVSISSILGGVCFATVHFGLVDDPWGHDQFAMSVVTIALLVLLVVRHRANLARIAAGTEPKVMLRKKRESNRSGRSCTRLVLVVAMACGVAAVAAWTARAPELRCREHKLALCARLATGLQRAERVAFAADGSLLAITCPRYNRVVLAKVSSGALEHGSELALGGRPVALGVAAKRLYVLERPIADAHHLEPGWLEAFDLNGQRMGYRMPVGFDPDDLALSADGRWALVLVSGHAEGETNRHDPQLLVVDLQPAGRATPGIRARLVFDQKADDPERVALDATETRAAVSLRGSNQVAWIDLAQRDQPRLVARTDLPGIPGPLLFTHHGDLVVASPEHAGLWRIASAGAPPQPLPISGPAADLTELVGLGGVLACTVTENSGIELIDPHAARSLGRLPIRWPVNLGKTRPLGLALDPAGNRLAVANRQGGSVFLIGIEALLPAAAQDPLAAADRDVSRR